MNCRHETCRAFIFLSYLDVSIYLSIYLSIPVKLPKNLPRALLVATATHHDLKEASTHERQGLP